MSEKVREHPGGPKAKVAPAKELVLIAVSGDIEVGAEFLIPPGEPLPIGRAMKGVQLTDPMVSIQHAHVFHDAKRGYVVEDLKSATGTWVDEECVRGESRPIGVGTRLRFGDTVFEVQPAHRTPAWFKWVGIAAGLMVAVAIGLFAAQQFVEPPVPELSCPESNLLGAVGIATVGVPQDFLRSRGLVLSELACERTTDDDDDGRAEAWLRAASGEQYVVVPESAPGEPPKWRLIGDLPAHCAAKGPDDPGEFPLLDCAGEQWMVVDGTYQVVGQDGVVVWYRETEGKPTEPAPEPAPGATPETPGTIELPGLQGMVATGPVKVGRFALKGDRLGSFLAFRGIDRPIHYLLCEEAFEGISAQALTDDEGVTGLRIGCISDLRLEGTPPAKPIAIALSAAGRKALIDDVTTFYAGNPDGLFLDGRWQSVVEQMKAEPGFLVGARKLVGDTKESDAPALSPFPDPSRTIRAAHLLDARDSRLEAAPIASTVTIVEEGDAQVDVPGCGLLKVHTNPFVKYGFSSVVAKPFLTIEEAGCGSPTTLASIGYTGGVLDLAVEGLDVRVVTESKASTRGLEIARTRITWRSTEKVRKD